jgi:uncharacterized iron-regulated membrane protein
MTLSSELEFANNLRPDQPALMSTLRLLLGLFGAPVVWTLQIALSEPLAARACYPNQAPLPEPSWEGWSVVIPAVSLACLAFALLSGWAALTFWRRQAPEPMAGRDESGRMRRGRIRFLSRLGLMSSGLFIVAVVFNTLAVLLVPLCSSWY